MKKYKVLEFLILWAGFMLLAFVDYRICFGALLIIISITMQVNRINNEIDWE